MSSLIDTIVDFIFSDLKVTIGVLIVLLTVCLLVFRYFKAREDKTDNGFID